MPRRLASVIAPVLAVMSDAELEAVYAALVGIRQDEWKRQARRRRASARRRRVERDHREMLMLNQGLLFPRRPGPP